MIPALFESIERETNFLVCVRVLLELSEKDQFESGGATINGSKLLRWNTMLEQTQSLDVTQWRLKCASPPFPPKYLFQSWQHSLQTFTGITCVMRNSILFAFYTCKWETLYVSFGICQLHESPVVRDKNTFTRLKPSVQVVPLYPNTATPQDLVCHQRQLNLIVRILETRPTCTWVSDTGQEKNDLDVTNSRKITCPLEDFSGFGFNWNYR